MPRRQSVSGEDELSRLVELGFSEQFVKRLRSAGIRSLAQVTLFNEEELVELLSLSDPEPARRLIATVRELLGLGPRGRTGREVIEEVSRMPVVRTGVEGLDNAVGGLRFGASHEFAGEFGAGKTIMALQVAVAAAAQLGVRVIYIDTERTLSQYLTSQLIKNLCNRFGIDYDGFINERLIVYTPATVDDLETSIKSSVTDQSLNNNARVIIVDSITALYRAQFRGRERLAERQQRLHYVLDWLRRLTIRLGCWWSTLIK
ncbi:ATPase domain-containing protein [Vulcanisaeta sp. JCM 14467]|uniref:ATPase domain-containing protein n=1 Tax=Vulcanisaeta sp. JCM 14467 TaxID=1295370 RepID=UPI000AFD61AA|nr:ATPase domain-containing protein [Vulcanisaeta sp. JCM 14467]